MQEGGDHAQAGWDTAGEGFCQREVLVSASSGAVFRCRCGIYHVRIGGTTLHLTASEFDLAARLFKLAFGTIVGHTLLSADGPGSGAATRRGPDGFVHINPVLKGDIR